MTGSSRSAKVAALGFLLVAGLVLGGLAWATVASLQLEQARTQATAEADHRDRLREALWRIDPLVMSVFAKEASRPYWHYSAFYYPPNALLTSGEDLTGSVVEPSPLLDGRDDEEWVLLHVQVSPLAGWNSPQIPPPDAWWVDPDELDSFEASARRTLLASLEKTHTPDAFAVLVADAEAAAGTARRWIIGADRADVVGDRRTTASQGQSAQRQSALRQMEQRAQSDYRRRGEQTLYVQTRNRPLRNNDPADVAFNNLWNVLTPDYADESATDVHLVEVTVSPMTPLWVRLADREGSLLAMVRTVEAEGNKVHQGFLVDWDKLSRLLRDRISDLFDQVDLEIVEAGAPHEPESTMTALPVKLVTGPVAITASDWWSGLNSTLIFAWVFALLALAAIGLGVRSLLTLTERRSQFAYAVTHELRTPLTTLCLYTDMLANGLVPSEKREDYVRTLRDESERLSGLVSGILEYSRVENRAIRLETCAVSVRELVNTIIEQYEPRCEQAGLELIAETTGAEDVVLRADPRLVVQILGNLIDNACKYAREGAHPQVTLAAAAADHNVTLEIEDTGPGIPRADRRHIFRPFRRGRGDGAPRSGGVGLGLALARSWAKLLGGRLELASTRPGRGARFRLTLPAECPA